MDESAYVRNIVAVAEQCGQREGRDRYHKATTAFFQSFAEQMADRGDCSPGDRHFMSKRFERAVIAGFVSVDGIDAAASPSIEWDDNIPFRKSLDIMVMADGRQKTVAIEIKSRGFNAIAAATMEFAMCAKHGMKLHANKTARDRFDVSRKVGPRITRYCLLMGDSTKQCPDVFQAQKTLFPGLNAEIHCLFNDWAVHSDEPNTNAITEAVYRFFKAQISFLTNGTSKPQTIGG